MVNLDCGEVDTEKCEKYWNSVVDNLEPKKVSDKLKKRLKKRYKISGRQLDSIVDKELGKGWKNTSLFSKRAQFNKAKKFDRVYHWFGQAQLGTCAKDPPSFKSVAGFRSDKKIIILLLLPSLCLNPWDTR